MSRYIYGRRSWSDPSSKYGLEPNKLDEVIRRNLERYESKQARIHETLERFMAEDPARQNETFAMILEWAREWKLKNVQ
ncbi:hypothetical protein UM396_14670 [Geobacillus subterraneus]|uniref:hypothetical protein n=1 Tax=Geobacillus subterraneus TaxID=129338 RepID=UPI002AC9CDF6|nr:hypothetical protein [Geobacillus subterraneus]WPZ17826.1 hypothetical protein UM396_14670 [Geobacillus subterraneus]